jgi:hypothetical protein
MKRSKQAVIIWVVLLRIAFITFGFLQSNAEVEFYTPQA